MALAQAIDELIEEQYKDMSHTSRKGELAQLTRLFSKKFTDGLAKLLHQQNRNSANIQTSVKVELGYIDKQPYAQYIDNTTQITGELSDVLFIFRDQIGTPSKVNNIKERALFFQAKVNTSNKIPIVPIRTGNSTVKEYKLLSGWPKFDLVKSPNSSSQLLNNVNIHDRNTDVFSHGWFGACPPSHLPVWRSRWMCAEAKTGQQCISTLGEVLEALYLGKSIRNIEIGRGFNSEKEVDHQNPEWNDLVNTVLKLCNESNAPSVLSSYSDTRLASSLIKYFGGMQSNNGNCIYKIAKCLYWFYNCHPDRLYPILYCREFGITPPSLDIKQIMELKKNFIDIAIWVYDEIANRNLDFSLENIRNIVIEYLSQNVTSSSDIEDNIIHPPFNTANGKGMFVLTVSILKQENQN